MTACCGRCALWSLGGGAVSAAGCWLAARLAEAYRLIGDLTAQVKGLSARVGQLERQAGKDSSSSSRPPSSDSPYKKNRDRSLRERGKRRPGKQPVSPGRR